MKNHPESTPWKDDPRPEWENLDPAVRTGAGQDLHQAHSDGEEGGDLQAASRHQEPLLPRAQGQGQQHSDQSLPPARPRALRLRQALIALTVPLLMILLSIRAVASTWFLWIEYHRPGFPADAYGFDVDQRMAYGSHGLDYVTNLAPARFLTDVRTDEGRALFSMSEVAHMTDVKNVLLWATAAVAALAVLALLSSIGLRRRAPGAIRRALSAGAWWGLILLIGLGVLGVLGWEQLFTGFHELFFPQGNWAFQADDTLIRLYPAQFWVDAAATTGALVLMLCSLLLVLTWPTHRRRQRELARRERLQGPR